MLTQYFDLTLDANKIHSLDFVNTVTATYMELFTSFSISGKVSLICSLVNVACALPFTT